MAGTKRHRDISDIGEDRPTKLAALTDVRDRDAGCDEPVGGATGPLAGMTSISSRLRKPSTRNVRAPLAINPVNANVTTRKKRSASAPPKDLRPPVAGIVKGHRVHETEAAANAVNKSAKTKSTKAADDDPRWRRFEAQRNGTAQAPGTNRTRRKSSYSACTLILPKTPTSR